MSKIYIETALNNLGNVPSLYRTLIQGFINKYSHIDEDIKKLMLEKDIADARRLAHSMKGLGGNLGAESLKEKAKQLELRLKPYIEAPIDDSIIASILNKEWISFSEELQQDLIVLKKILEVDDETIEKTRDSDELFMTSKASSYIEQRFQFLEDDNLGINETDKASELIKDDDLYSLISALNTCNYLTVRKTLMDIDYKSLSETHGGHWDKAMDYIHEFEYDKAKKELQKGVNDEE